MSIAARVSLEGLDDVAIRAVLSRPGVVPVVSLAMPTTPPPKRRVKGGRVTPKRTPEAAARPDPSSRYTPPVPKEYKVSPRWVPVLMFAFLAIGLVVIFLNYLGVLPGGTKNSYLLVGLGAILGGIMTATQYR